MEKWNDRDGKREESGGVLVVAVVLIIFVIISAWICGCGCICKSSNLYDAGSPATDDDDGDDDSADVGKSREMKQS